MSRMSPIFAILLGLLVALVDFAPALALTDQERTVLQQALRERTVVETVRGLPTAGDPAARAREILEFLAGEVQDPEQLGQLGVEVFEGIALGLARQGVTGEDFVTALLDIAPVVLTLPTRVLPADPPRKQFYRDLFGTARSRSVADATEVSDPVARVLGILILERERWPGIPAIAVEAAGEAGFLAYAEALQPEELAPVAGPAAPAAVPVGGPRIFAPFPGRVSPDRARIASPS